MDATPIVQWAATVTSTLVIAAGTALINQRMKESDRKADERHAQVEAEQQRRDAWREGISARLGNLESDVRATKEASQVNMRQNLLHYAEKYITRGWVTPEERAAIYEMHQKYTALDANGYIDGYMQRVMALPDKVV